MEWTLAHPLQDVEDIVLLADQNYGSEVEGVLKRDRAVFRKNVTIASTVQLFDKGKEFLAVCRTTPVPIEEDILKKHPDWEPVHQKLLGFCWFDRGGYTTYSNEEISNAKFHHVDLFLSARTRVLLVNQMIDQHVPVSYTHLTLPTIYSV